MGGSDHTSAESAVLVKECADDLIVMKNGMKNDRGPDNLENEEPRSKVEMTPDGVGGIAAVECNIVKKTLRCTSHDCAVVKRKVTSKKWGRIARLAKYGYLNSQTTKYVCSARNVGRVGRDISPAQYNCTGDKPGPGVGDLAYNTRGGGENNGIESESFSADLI